MLRRFFVFAMMLLAQGMLPYDQPELLTNSLVRQEKPSKTNNNSEKNTFDRFFLVRAPDFLDFCRIKLPERYAVLVISPGTVEGTIKAGDTFSLIARNSEIVKGAIERIISNCVDEDFGVDTLSYGSLLLNRALSWPRDNTSYIAIKGTSLTRDMIGTVKGLPLDPEAIYQAVYRDQIAKELPAGVNLSISIIYHIILPHSTQEFDYVATEYSFSEEYRTAGDKAIRSAGFLFQNGRIILRNNDITRIMAVTRLSNDGVYEVVVRSGNLYAANYEVRLFDGKKFSEPKKVLYRWMD